MSGPRNQSVVVVAHGLWQRQSQLHILPGRPKTTLFARQFLAEMKARILSAARRTAAGIRGLDALLAAAGGRLSIPSDMGPPTTVLPTRKIFPASSKSFMAASAAKAACCVAYSTNP